MSPTLPGHDELLRGPQLANEADGLAVLQAACSALGVQLPSLMSLRLDMTAKGMPLGMGTGFAFSWGDRPWLITNRHNLTGRRQDNGEPIHRSAATPETVKRYVKEGFAVQVAEGAGVAANFVDADYEAAGAAPVAGGGWPAADVVLKVAPPTPAEAEARGARRSSRDGQSCQGWSPHRGVGQHHTDHGR